MLVVRKQYALSLLYITNAYHFVTGENFHYTRYTLSRTLIAHDDRNNNL